MPSRKLNTYRGEARAAINSREMPQTSDKSRKKAQLQVRF